MTYTYWSGARGSSVFYDHEYRTIRLERYLTALIVVTFVLASISITIRIFGGVEKMNLPLPVQNFLIATPLAAAAKPATPSTEINGDEISKVLSAWASKNRGSESVVVATADGTVLSSSGADETFFMASIYKLYVAYLGYQDIDAGVHSLNEPFLSGMTRGMCLDEMIRTSDSPCAERLMSELGRQNIQTRLESYGLTKTSFKGLNTSAHDVSIVLGRLWQGTDLSTGSRAVMLDSMLGQKYRNGLAKGFGGSAVYNKVGFRDQAEYHDVGIVQLPDGQPLIVTVLSSNVGVRNISQLGASILKTTTN